MTTKPSANLGRTAIGNSLKAAVLTGGIGSERDISLQSGQCVAHAIKQAGLDVVVADINPNKLDILDDASIDVFFLALHGQFGEDGQLQQILEDKSLVYTGSGPEASRLAFDKMASKKAFAKAGINTPPAIEFNPGTNVQQLEKQLRQLADKYVIKPTREGSSVGISIVTKARAAIETAQECQRQFGSCIIEKFIRGREITAGILCGQALPIIEVRPMTDFYSYQAKYIDEQTEYLFDTITDTMLAAKIQKTALECFNAIGCRDFARIDFILDDDQIIYALEVNTIPGFTTHSLLPKAAAKTGLSMSNLCVKIIETALKNKKETPVINQNSH